MADELGAELSLDLDAARREIESFRRDIEDELERAVTTFGDSYRDTISGLPAIEPEIESQIVTEELERAIQATDTELAVTTDGEAITSDINEAVGAANPVVELDTEPMVASLIDVIEDTHPVIEPELDTTAVRSSLDDLAASFESGAVEGTAFETADLRAQELEDSLGDLNETGGETRDVLGSVSNVSTTTATAFSAARGDGSKLISTLTQMDPRLRAVGGAALGVSAGFVALFQAGQANVQSLERANLVLGEAAERIERINVGGLTGGLGDLARQAGSSDNALRNAAASAAQIGLSSGKSTGEVTEFANKVNALALRAVAMNPALGDAGAVAERLSQVLARGGRFLVRYGLDLTAAEITMRALSDTGKDSVADLSLFERSVAGADIAVEKLGDRLGKDFAEGAASTTLRLRALKTSIGDAFAAAGEDLVEPAVDGLESLAEAATDVSKILGEIGRVVVPPVAEVLGVLGETASVAADALDLIPAPVLAGAAAFLIFRNNIFSLLRGLTAATSAAPSLINVIGGGPELQATGSRFSNVMGNVVSGLNTFQGRALIGLGSTIALNEGLKRLGTSTEELGVQFVTTGASIGFALGGLPGLLTGAGLGAIAQAVTAASDLEEATAQVDEQFRKAEASSEGLEEALFAGADTAVGLASAISGLNVNLANFIRDAGAFKALGADDDLRRFGLSFSEVASLIREGEAGLAQFFGRIRGGAGTIDFAKEIGGDLGLVESDLRKVLAVMDDTDEAIGRNTSLTTEQAEAALQLKKTMRDLGVEAEITGGEFADMTGEQQRQVLAAARSQGINTKLLVAFQTMQKQVRETSKAQFEMFTETNRLSPAIVDVTKQIARGEGETVNWEKALKIANDAIVGILPTLSGFSDDAGRLLREFSGLTGALDGAAAKIPQFGSALERAFSASVFTIEGEDFLNFDLVAGNLATQTGEIQTFFDNVRKIAEQGASNVAAALLQLGPDNLGARVAADLAANQTPFREGLEKAFEGFAQAQLFGESLINTMRSRINFLTSTIGDDLQTQLRLQFGETDLSKISTPQLVAFVERFGTFGSQALQELVDNFNREMAVRKLNGIDTGPIEQSVQEARDRLAGVPAQIGDNLEAAQQHVAGFVAEANATLGTAFDPVPPEVQATTNEIVRIATDGMTQFGLTLKDVPPEVQTEVDKIVRIATDGATDAAAEWDTHFGQIRVFTGESLDRTQVVVDERTGIITDRVTGAIVGAIDASYAGAFGAAERVGRATSDGISAGIYAGFPGISRAAADQAQHYFEELDRQFIVGSPSKAAMQRGRWVGEGLAAGMMQTLGLLDNASDAMATHALPTLAGVGGGFGSTPLPPQGGGLAQKVRVSVDPTMLGISNDSSISVGAINNYGPTLDARGASTMRKLRTAQWLGA